MPFDLDILRPGMTREDVVQLFGQPDDVGGTSRKYRTPNTYLYGDFEVCFESWKSGKIGFVFDRVAHETVWSAKVYDKLNGTI